MSRPCSHRSRWRAYAGACILGAALQNAQAQTIADYSRAQRAVLESAMTQAAARSAALPLAASAPAPGGPASIPAAHLAPPHAQADAVAPALRISGVVATSASTLTEVVVDGAAYLLAPGQDVPGTAWRVEAVATDRVVLARPGSGAAAGGTQTVRRIYALPPLRRELR